MKLVVAIRSLKQNTYFHKKAMGIFSEIQYMESRPTREEMPAFLSLGDVAIIGAREKVDKEIMSKSSKLPKIIGTLSVGLDHLDVPSITSNNIKIINAPTANVLSVAEHIIAFALSLAKRLKESDIAVQNNEGRKGVSVSPFELNEKTFGLIGYGKIAKQCSKLAQCLGMDVIATSKSNVSGKDGHVQFMPLKDLLKKSDVISISVPLDESTNRLIDSDKLIHVKRGSLLINTSRSAVVCHEAIRDALDKGLLSGYAEDSDSIPNYLSDRINVVTSPHLAGLTNEASDRLDNELIDRIYTHINS